VEEYCWAITQALGMSIYARSISAVLEFRFKLEFLLFTYTVDDIALDYDFYTMRLAPDFRNVTTA
jgi:hypothetical protein